MSAVSSALEPAPHRAPIPQCGSIRVWIRAENGIFGLTLSGARMSSLEGDEPKVRFEFKGKFGAAPSTPMPDEEASHEEIDAFVKSILGLTKEKSDWRT